ncbi:MAG: OmpA family protein, partial [Bacteroidota bacterium]
MGKTILVLSVFAVWCLICQQWYVCGIKQACAQGAAAATPSSVQSSKSLKPTALPIAFRWQSAQPLLGANYTTYRDSILSLLKNNQVLRITAHYHTNENNGTDSITYGMERALAVRDLFLERLPAERLQLAEKKIDNPANPPKRPFAALQFDYIDDVSLPVETTKSSVVSFGDGVRIYFGFNAARGEMDDTVQAYLNQLADTLILRGNTVRVTGHTDDVGEAKSNYNIGLRRAKSVRTYLREKGVPRAQIQIFSKGETEPIATNTTAT